MSKDLSNPPELISEVSLNDLYTRMGRLEQGQSDINQHLASLRQGLAELKAGFNGGPANLKQRVSRLEARWNQLFGGFLLLTFLVSVVGAFSFLAQRGW